MAASFAVALGVLFQSVQAGTLPKSALPENGIVMVALSSAAMTEPIETWETLTIDSWTLSIRLPSNATVVRRCGDSSTCLMLELEVIPEISDADGACSTSSQEVALRQKEAIGRARSSAEARTALELRTYSMSSLAGLTKNGGLKIAYGLQDCQGDVSDIDSISWYVGEAAWYLGDKAFSIRLPFRVGDSVLVKDSPAYIESIRLKRSQNVVRQWWELFEKVVRSVNMSIRRQGA